MASDYTAVQLPPRTMGEFVFPSKPEQLLEPDCESSLCVVTEINVAEMAPEETEHLVEGVTCPCPVMMFICELMLLGTPPPLPGLHGHAALAQSCATTSASTTRCASASSSSSTGCSA